MNARILKAREQAVMDSAGAYGLPPEKNPDGTLNVPAMNAAIKKKSAESRIQEDIALNASRDRVILRNQADALGIPWDPAGAPPDVTGPAAPPPSALPPPDAAGPGIAAQTVTGDAAGTNLRRQIFLKQASIKEAEDNRVREENKLNRQSAAATQVDAARETAKIARDDNAQIRNEALTRGQKDRASLLAKLNLPPEEEAEADAILAANGGKFPSPEVALTQSVEVTAMSLEALKPLMDLAGKMDKDAFGPIDTRAATAAGKLWGGGQQHREVEQAFNNLAAGRSFAQGGKALTENEINFIMKQIGTPNDADFPQRLASFLGRLNNDTQRLNAVLGGSDFKYSPEAKGLRERLDYGQNLYKKAEPEATKTKQTPAKGLPDGWTYSK